MRALSKAEKFAITFGPSTPRAWARRGRLLKAVPRCKRPTFRRQTARCCGVTIRMRRLIDLTQSAHASALAGILLLAGLPAVSSANTVCSNGECVTCDGPISCTNGACTCHGAPVGPGNGTLFQQRACGGEPTTPHPNGGGAVSTKASVAPSVFVSTNSAVCGRAIVTGATRLQSGSVVNGAARVPIRS